MNVNIGPEDRVRMHIDTALDIARVHNVQILLTLTSEQRKFVEEQRMKKNATVSLCVTSKQIKTGKF